MEEFAEPICFTPAISAARCSRCSGATERRLAEGEGFEPPDRENPVNSFQGCRNQPDSATPPAVHHKARAAEGGHSSCGLQTITTHTGAKS
jgi:hypothetical protein